MVKIWDTNIFLREKWEEEMKMRYHISHLVAINIGVIDENVVMQILQDNQKVIIYGYGLHWRHRYLLPYFDQDKIIFIKSPILGEDIVYANKILELNKYHSALNPYGSLIYVHNKPWIDSLRSAKKMDLSCWEVKKVKLVNKMTAAMLELILGFVFDELFPALEKLKNGEKLKILSMVLMMFKDILLAVKKIEKKTSTKINDIIFKLLIKKITQHIAKCKKRKRRNELSLIGLFLYEITRLFRKIEKKINKKKKKKRKEKK